MQKVSRKAAVAITAGKCQEVAAFHGAVLVVADFATLFGGVGESFLLSKEVAKRYKRLKDC